MDYPEFMYQTSRKNPLVYKVFTVPVTSSGSFLWLVSQQSWSYSCPTLTQCLVSYPLLWSSRSSLSLPPPPEVPSVWRTWHSCGPVSRLGSLVRRTLGPEGQHGPCLTSSHRWCHQRHCLHAQIYYKESDITRFIQTRQCETPGPEVIKLFSCSSKLSTKFQLLIITKILTNKEVFCFQSLRYCIYHDNKC